MLESLLWNVVSRSQAPGEIWKLIRSACAEMKSTGERFQETAVKSHSVGEFYGGLFVSAPWLFGALRGLKYLIASNVGARETEVATNVCDERSTIACTSMAIQFGNSIDVGEWQAGNVAQLLARL
jgi:hypothetical protein